MNFLAHSQAHYEVTRLSLKSQHCVSILRVAWYFSDALILYAKPPNEEFIIPLKNSFIRPLCHSAFSPYFCPVLQSNNVAYFARSIALIS